MRGGGIDRGEEVKKMKAREDSRRKKIKESRLLEIYKVFRCVLASPC